MEEKVAMFRSSSRTWRISCSCISCFSWQQRYKIKFMYQTQGHLGHWSPEQAHLQMLPEPYVFWRVKEGARGKKLVGKLREEGSLRSFPKHDLTGDHRVNGEGLQRWQGRVFNVHFDLIKSKAEGEQILTQISKVPSYHETLLSGVFDPFHFAWWIFPLVVSH